MQGRKQKWKYSVAGALAGLANGLFGAGGGMFLAPLLAQWTKLPQRKAFATSVAVYWWKGAVDLSAAWPYLLGGFLGGLVSGRVFQKVPVDWLRRGFGLLILYGGVRALFFA